MSRAIFKAGEQKTFFQNIKNASRLSNAGLGKLVGISGRSYQDWSSERTYPKVACLQLLAEKFEVPIPKNIEIREEFWSGRINGRKAALARLAKYGPPGTTDGRRKGGKNSQENRRKNPAHYKALGCNVQNSFTNPKKNQFFAEFIGVMLGDGGITSTQCRITLDATRDSAYSKYLVQLIKRLFEYQASIIPKKGNAIDILMSGVELTKILEKNGLQQGHKVKKQVDIPQWIKNKKSLYKSCIRGLFDTDGGVIFHEHTVNQKKYSHLNLCFSNFSIPLRESFQNGLTLEGIKSSINKHCVMIYNSAEIKKFFTIYKPSNQKHWERYERYIKTEVSDSGLFETPGKRWPSGPVGSNPSTSAA